MKPYEQLNRIYLPIACFIFIMTFYYSLGFAEFEREKNFSKDLRINLPEYIIEDKQVTSIYDGGRDEGLFLYDSLAYSIILNAPLPNKSIKVILSERRGWEHVSGDTYSFGRNLMSERMECTYTIRENKFSISYLYDFDSFVLIIYPIVVTIALAIIYVVMLIVLSLFQLARTRSLNNRTDESNI